MKTNDIFVCGDGKETVTFYKVERFTNKIVWLIPVEAKVTRSIRFQKEVVPDVDKPISGSKKYLIQPTLADMLKNNQIVTSEESEVKHIFGTFVVKEIKIKDKLPLPLLEVTNDYNWRDGIEIGEITEENREKASSYWGLYKNY